MSEPAADDGQLPIFRAASAAGNDWSRVLRGCLAQLDPLPESRNIGFVFLSDGLAAEADAILNGLRQETGIERWVGTAASAVYRQGMRQPLGEGLAVLVGALPERSAWLFDAQVPNGPSLGHVALLHIGADIQDPEAQLAMLANRSPFWALGGTTHRSTLPLSVAGALSEGGITGAGFTEGLALVPIVVRAGVTLGAPCRLDEQRMRALIRLDGRPALDVALERGGDLMRHRPALMTQQISVGISAGGDHVRAVARIVGFDREQGSLALDRPLPPCSQVHFLRRDGASAQIVLKEAIAQARRSLAGRTAKALVYYLPRERQEHALGPVFDELGSIREALGMPPAIGVVVDQAIVGTSLESLTAVGLIVA